MFDSFMKLLVKEENVNIHQDKILPMPTLEGVAEAIRTGICKNIIVLSGAGISVAAGIPDFRTPGTGLYDNLEKYKLPYPEAIFEIGYFKENPNPFFVLAKELYPGNFDPTPCHYFVNLLNQKGLLIRNYTQNIDTLERVAGVPEDKLVEAHGSFGKAHCISCHEEYTSEEIKVIIFRGDIPRCRKCKSLVKPDIVFFGENLPMRFFDLMKVDFPKCDLLIVMGTSLKVHPFASLVEKVNENCPRILINYEEVHVANSYSSFLGVGGFTFNLPGNVRDVKALGDCQENIKKLVHLLGWDEEFNSLQKID